MNSEVTSFIVQLRDDAGLDQGGKGRGIEECSDSGYSLYFV